MLYVDLSHTSHTLACTGIQQVCRNIFFQLQDKQSAKAISYDPYMDCWRNLDQKEENCLRAAGKADLPKKRKAQWSNNYKIKGFFHKQFNRDHSKIEGTIDGILFPELFNPFHLKDLQLLKDQSKGPVCAIFHDAIALRMPQFSNKETVSRFPYYLKKLLEFDAIATVSEFSKEELLNYWKSLGIKNHPPVRAIPLGSHLKTQSQTSEKIANPPSLLCVATLEGRKNHLALLDAVERLWKDGEKFQLRLVGALNKKTGSAALQKYKQLKADKHPIHYCGPISNAELDEEYRNCDISVYPSLMEGFGLPVLESISYGKPCIASTRGALKETTQKGACIELSDCKSETISQAIKELLNNPQQVEKLQEEAKHIQFKSWDKYSDELLQWMQQVERRT